MDLPIAPAVLVVASALVSPACTTSPMEPPGSESSSGGSSGDDDFDSSDDGEDEAPKLDTYVQPDVGISCIEPDGPRIAVVDCEPCATSEGFGYAYDPAWVVTRLVPPSYPYRVDTLMAKVSTPASIEMFWLVDDFEVPSVDLVFADAITLDVPWLELAVWELGAPIVLEEGEFLFVGVTIPVDDSVYSCDDDTVEDLRVFMSPATRPAEWINLLDTAPVVFAYGEPGEAPT